MKTKIIRSPWSRRFLAIVVVMLCASLYQADAQLSWKSLPSGVQYQVNDIVFVSESLAYIAADDGVVLKSMDAGATWKKIILPWDFDLRTIEFFNDTVGFASPGGVILATRNGGESWDSIYVPQGDLAVTYECDMIDSTCVACAGGRWQGIQVKLGTVLMSHDQGRTWEDRSSGIGDVIYGIDFVSREIGVAVSARGSVYRTEDAGINWTLIDSTESIRYEDVDFFDSRRGMIVGTGGNVRVTEDSGKTWMDRDIPGGDWLNSVDFDDKSGVRVVTASGWIYYSSDFGMNWTPEYVAQSHWLLEIEHGPDGVCIATGRNGLLLRGIWTSGVDDDRRDHETTPDVSLHFLHHEPVLVFNQPMNTEVSLRIYSIDGEAIDNLLLTIKGPRWMFPLGSYLPSSGNYILEAIVDRRSQRQFLLPFYR